MFFFNDMFSFYLYVIADYSQYFGLVHDKSILDEIKIFGTWIINFRILRCKISSKIVTILFWQEYVNYRLDVNKI